MKLHRADEDLILASEAESSKCQCIFTIGVDKDGEAIVVGGMQCDKFPDCRFPIHLALMLAQADFDHDAVRPKYQLKTPPLAEMLPEP